MPLEILGKMGLSKGEIKVYSALLDMGLAPVNRIHEETGIERRNIYDILNKLIERGLISYITENKKRLFQASHPNKILGYIEEKKHDLDRTRRDVEKEMPSIMERFNSRRPEINAEIFRGTEGVKAVWEDMLNYKAIYWVGSGRYVPKRLPSFFASWDRKRVKLKVRMFNMLRRELRNRTKVYQLESVKFLPKEFSVNPGVICIYGNKVVNFLYGDNFFGFVIENREIAENYRRYHKYIWDNVAK
ncbi:MAG: helix-turn-helix domain-containing protein [Candidatus Aenigmarchaeota archaeon]|nr:helix-turn-helix domain-containing protein [Candidatus Aenigmarchaeota archaeon]